MVLQDTVCPPLTEAVQRPELAKPVSVVWQVTVAPLPDDAEQELALTKPVSVVWQEMRVPEPLNAPPVLVHEEALTKPLLDVVQLTSERALPVMLLLLLQRVVESTVLDVEAAPPLKLAAAAVMPELPVVRLTDAVELPALAGAMSVT